METPLKIFATLGSFLQRRIFHSSKIVQLGFPASFHSLLREQMAYEMSGMAAFPRPIPHLPAFIEKERDRKAHSPVVPFHFARYIHPAFYPESSSAIISACFITFSVASACISGG